MGMFDTIFINVLCPYCKKEHNDIQTKAFANFLDEYKTGDLLEHSPIENDILKRAAYDSCDEAHDLFYCDIKVKNYKLVGLGKPVKNENYVKKRTELEKKIKESTRYKKK